MAVADAEADAYRQAWAAQDPDNSNTFVGEVTGLIGSIDPVAEIIGRAVAEAAALMAGASARVTLAPTSAG